MAMPEDHFYNMLDARLREIREDCIYIREECKRDHDALQQRVSTLEKKLYTAIGIALVVSALGKLLLDKLMINFSL